MPDIVIAGAGIAGIATACELIERHGVRDITLVDPRPPLTLTSDKSGANYREWWPERAMVQLVRRSIDLMTSRHRSGAPFSMNRRGYLYVTRNPDRALAFPDTVEVYRMAGIHQIRIHGPGAMSEPYQPAAEGLTGPDGADLLLSPALVHDNFPHLSASVAGAIHARNAGSVDPVGLGKHLLATAEDRGARLVRGEITGVEVAGHRVRAVTVATSEGTSRLETGCFVNATGPFLRRVSDLVDRSIPLPIDNVVQQKVWLPDPLGILPRAAPFTISLDPIEPLPAGLHIKPESSGGRPGIKLGWAFNQRPEEASWEPGHSPEFAQIVLQGGSGIIEGLAAYLPQLPTPVIQTSGYYVKTPDELPLIGPVGPEGSFVVGGLAGYGAMAACAVGEIAAAWIAGGSRPALASDFLVSRFHDPALVAGRLARQGSTGAL